MSSVPRSLLRYFRKQNATGGDAMTTPADAPQVNVPALIDAQKIGTFQIRVAVLCAAVVFMDGFDAQAIGYVAPTLSKAWSLKPGELGWTFSAGLVGLMLGALAFSPVADRIGRKPIIIFCTLWFGVASLLTVQKMMIGLRPIRSATGLNASAPS